MSAAGPKKPGLKRGEGRWTANQRLRGCCLFGPLGLKNLCGKNSLSALSRIHPPKPSLASSGGPSATAPTQPSPAATPDDSPARFQTDTGYRQLFSSE